jgi:hypothetical protein
MSIIRNRAKNSFPMVLLTLLSIVQAIAFELLWAELHEHPEFYQLSWDALMAWIRVATTLFGIILIWSSYATNVMRFRWVPSSTDMMFPFLIGIVQFTTIDNLGTEDIVGWLLCLGVLFAVMTGIAHHDMSRARQDDENSEFFNRRDRAKFGDFLPMILVVTGLFVFSFSIWLTRPDGWLASVASLLAFLMICSQMVIALRFWEWSMSFEPAAEEASGS